MTAVFRDPKTPPMYLICDGCGYQWINDIMNGYGWRDIQCEDCREESRLDDDGCPPYVAPWRHPRGWPRYWGVPA